jgi:hypothetical protein
MSAPEYLDSWLNYYECPDCDHHWYDVWDCQVDDACPECWTKGISPTDSWQLIDGGIEDMAVWQGSFQPLVDDEGNSPVDDSYLPLGLHTIDDEYL